MEASQNEEIATNIAATITENKEGSSNNEIRNTFYIREKELQAQPRGKWRV